MLNLAHQNLASSIAEAAPRVLSVYGPAGYRKTEFLREYALHCGPLVSCDIDPAGESRDIVRSVVDALDARDDAQAARSAAGRLAERRELVAATTREALRREWSRECAPELFVLRDVTGGLATAAGLDAVGELLAALPAGRTLAIMTRTALPPALAQIVERERNCTIRPTDLAFDPEEVEELVRHAGLPATASRSVYDVARGWPLASRLLIDLARHDAKTVAEAAELAFDTLLSFAAHRTIARLNGVVREALIVAILLRGATQRDLLRVLGPTCDDLVLARLGGLAFVETEADRVVVHPEIARLMRDRFAPLVSAVYERTLTVLSGDGAYVAAARVAIEGGDVKRAAAVLDAAPPYTAARVPLGEYERILDRMDRDLITRYPNVWLATIPYRAFSVDRATYVREAETVYYCLPRTASTDQRAVVLIHLASAYTNAGRISESEQLLEEALAGFAREPSSARATLLTFCATLRGIEGRFTLARALAAEAAAIVEPDFVFGENQTLHYIDAHEAAFRGQYDRAAVMFDELMRRFSTEELPLYLAYAATNGALVAWTYGDDVRFQRCLDVLENRLTPGLQRGFAPMIDAARGRLPHFEVSYLWPVLAAIAHLYRVGEAAGRADALEAARSSARSADERRDPYVQVFAHTALYVLDPAARAVEETALLQIAGGTESPELQDAVRRLVRGEPAGFLEPFVRLRVLRDRERREARLVVQLLAGCVTRDGEPVKLTDKELELLALLASSHTALSRDRIGEALWDHLDPEEWSNNIKVTLSRLRSKLGVRDAVVATGGGYRLAPTIDVDLRQAEAVIRERRTGLLGAAARDELRAIVTSFRSGSSTRYERFAWMQSTLVRMHEIVCSAGLTLAGDALTAERFDEALAESRAVAEIDPYNESACEIIVRALTARGDPDAARREFRRYASALAADLGASPSPRLVALVSESA